jgi:hypothetical protein
MGLWVGMEEVEMCGVHRCLEESLGLGEAF